MYYRTIFMCSHITIAKDGRWLTVWAWMRVNCPSWVNVNLQFFLFIVDIFAMHYKLAQEQPTVWCKYNLGCIHAHTCLSHVHKHTKTMHTYTCTHTHSHICHNCCCDQLCSSPLLCTNSTYAHTTTWRRFIWGEGGQVHLRRRGREADLADRQ